MIDAFILRIIMVLIPFDLPSSVGWTGAYIRGTDYILMLANALRTYG